MLVSALYQTSLCKGDVMAAAWRRRCFAKASLLFDMQQLWEKRTAQETGVGVVIDMQQLWRRALVS